MTSGDPSLTTGRTRSWPSADFRYLAVILAWFAGAALLGIGREVPVIDDWTYAWSVEQLLRTGRFDVLDFSAVYPFSVALWGTAWASILGLSFVTLRLSTLAAASVATIGLYLLLRELRAPRHLALLGAFVVAANPMFFLLSSSFMTDVPFVACTIMALLCYVRARSRERVGLVWWAGFWGVAALLIRPVGVITPVAGLPLLLLHAHHDRGTLPRRHVLGALAATWIVMGLSWWALTSVVPPTTVMAGLRERLSYLLLVSPTGYLVANVNMITMFAFYALPALLAMAATQRLWRARTLVLMAALGAVLFAIAGEIPEPLKPGNIWSPGELGLTRGLMRAQSPADLPAWIAILMRGAGLLAVALGLAGLVAAFERRRGDQPSPMPDTRRSLRSGLERIRATIVGSPASPVVFYLGAYIVVANILWFYHDRYWVPVLFAFVVLALGRPVVVRRAPALAWSVVAMFAVTSVVGTRDTLRFNEAVRDSWQTLVDRGVPPSDIDAGYSWNGWSLYAHPENLAKGQHPHRDVPWISTMRMTPYMLAMSPIEGYVVEREVAWDDFAWPGPDRLFVLRRKPLH